MSYTIQTPNLARLNRIVEAIERQIHQNRLLKLAREGGQMTSADLMNFEPQRRYATLVALAVEGTATGSLRTIASIDRPLLQFPAQIFCTHLACGFGLQTMIAGGKYVLQTTERSIATAQRAAKGELQQLSIAQFLRLEDDLNRLGMISMIAIRGVRNITAGISDSRRDDARVAAQQVLHAPKAATG